MQSTTIIGAGQRLGRRMRTYKRTRITLETEQVLMIQQRSSNRRWCPECSKLVDMVRFAQAAALAGVSPARLHECAQTEPWHVIEAQDGTSLICLDSMLNAQAGKNHVEQDEKKKDH